MAIVNFVIFKQVFRQAIWSGGLSGGGYSGSFLFLVLPPTTFLSQVSAPWCEEVWLFT